MTWAQTAKRYLAVFETRARACPTCNIAAGRSQSSPESKGHAIPEIRIGHFLSLCDSTGMLQHAVHSVPDRAHGYCVDDNARALLFSCALATVRRSAIARDASRRALRRSSSTPGIRTPRRFRNFMSYDRRWLEESGSEDSHGRTLWALAECARKDTDPSRRRWAAALFKTALPAVEEFSSPRAWAFSLLGLDAYCALVGGDVFANRVRRLLADRLMSLLSATETKDWVWFEDVLAYDNARLPQALIQTGLATRTPRICRGRPAIAALAHVAADHAIGIFQAGRDQELRQAPPEARSVRSAAGRGSGNDFRLPCRVRGRTAARSGRQGQCARFAWFLGENDLRTALIDPDTGSCSDGLHPDRPNENKGAELVLSYLLGLVEMRQFNALRRRIARRPASEIGAERSFARSHPRTTPGGIFVSIPIPQSPGLTPASGSGQGRRQTLQTGD